MCFLSPGDCVRVPIMIVIRISCSSPGVVGKSLVTYLISHYDDHMVQPLPLAITTRIHRAEMEIKCDPLDHN